MSSAPPSEPSASTPSATFERTLEGTDLSDTSTPILPTAVEPSSSPMSSAPPPEPSASTPSTTSEHPHIDPTTPVLDIDPTTPALDIDPTTPSAAPTGLGTSSISPGSASSTLSMDVDLSSAATSQQPTESASAPDATTAEATPAGTSASLPNPPTPAETTPSAGASSSESATATHRPSGTNADAELTATSLLDDTEPATPPGPPATTSAGASDATATATSEARGEEITFAFTNSVDLSVAGPGVTPARASGRNETTAHPHNEAPTTAGPVGGDEATTAAAAAETGESSTATTAQATESPLQTSPAPASPSTRASAPPAAAETSAAVRPARVTTARVAVAPPARTTAAAPLPLTLTQTTTKTVPGLEALGPVRVLYEAFKLGVPSATEETVYAPFEGVRIVVPPGAWVVSRRRAEPRPLTVTVFFLPDGLAAPGTSCGPALDLGPRDQALALPIMVSLPCDANGTRARPYSLDVTSGLWKPDEIPTVAPGGGNAGAVWAQTRALGAHAALTTAEAGNSNRDDSGTSVGVVAGATVGAIAAASLAGAALWRATHSGDGAGDPDHDADGKGKMARRPSRRISLAFVGEVAPGGPPQPEETPVDVDPNAAAEIVFEGTGGKSPVVYRAASPRTLEVPPVVAHTDLVFLPDDFNLGPGGPWDPLRLSSPEARGAYPPPPGGWGWAEEERLPLPIIFDARDSLWCNMMGPADLCFNALLPLDDDETGTRLPPSLEDDMAG